MPRAFAHPVYWSALLLLIVNDHVLKGAGVLPGAITGKLSDFAGMLVAPPLLALVLGAGRRGARMLAVALVGALFALIKLWPDAARALEQTLALAHVRSRVWLDATDLWALALLPLALPLCAPPAARPQPRRSAGWAARAVVGVAALACVATTGSDDEESDGQDDLPQIENDTGDPLAVIVASTEGAGGCGLYRDDRISALTAGAFIAPRELVMQDGARAALPVGSSAGRCGAASIGLPGGQTLLVFWRDLDEIESLAPDDDERWRARRVRISGGEGDFAFDIGEDLETFELGGEPPEPTCPEIAPAHTLEFTALAAAQGFFELGELRAADDGCLEVDWFAPAGDTSPDTQRLCVPDWAFPFEVGEQLSLVQEIDPLGPRALSVTRHGGDGVDRQLLIWNDADELAGSRATGLRPLDCVGVVSACGAYVRPLELEIRGREEPLQSGDELTVEGEAPKETRLLVGAARDVAWSSGTCEGGDARVGARVSLLELRSY
jgi:hypothetical protein